MWPTFLSLIREILGQIFFTLREIHGPSIIWAKFTEI